MAGSCYGLDSCPWVRGPGAGVEDPLSLLQIQTFKVSEGMREKSFLPPCTYQHMSIVPHQRGTEKIWSHVDSPLGIMSEPRATLPERGDPPRGGLCFGRIALCPVLAPLSVE